MLKRTNPIKDSAAEYLRRDWSPIRLKTRSKEPNGKHSSNTITWDNVETLRDNENLGVQFSEQGKLKDIDPDYQCAAELVRELGLHDATAAFGRAAGIRHLLYNSPRAKAKKFELPEGDYPKPLPIYADKPSLLVVEIRGADNTYTMFPPSVHPETGETLEWHGDRREPAEMSAADLRTMAGRIAFAASVLYFYPLDPSARYDVRMAITVPSRARTCRPVKSLSTCRQWRDWPAIPSGGKTFPSARRNGWKTTSPSPACPSWCRYCNCPRPARGRFMSGWAAVTT